MVSSFCLLQVLKTIPCGSCPKRKICFLFKCSASNCKTESGAHVIQDGLPNRLSTFRRSDGYGGRHLLSA